MWVDTPKRDLKGHSDNVLSPTLDRVAGTTSWHMWVTVPSGECMGVIRMVLPTASFLPGCHMVGSRRGTREMSQSSSRGICGKTEGQRFSDCRRRWPGLSHSKTRVFAEWPTPLHYPHKSGGVTPAVTTSSMLVHTCKIPSNPRSSAPKGGSLTLVTTASQDPHGPDSLAELMSLLLPVHQHLSQPQTP